MARHVEAARAAGAEILAGGEGVERDGMKTGWVPTVLTLDAEDQPVLADETFRSLLGRAARRGRTGGGRA